jgi:DNA gyrase subunit A
VGLITQKTTDKVGVVVGAKRVKDHQELILTTNLGQVIRTRIKDISIMGRNTQGVKLMSLDQEQEQITSFALLDEQDEESEPTNLQHH